MNSEQTKILSIIIPAFNIAPYLERCVASMLDATYSHKLDVLIIDDGSTDETKDIAARLAVENPGVVRHVRKENGHYGTAVNRGIDEAAGLFLKIVDGDDFVDPAGLDQLVSFLGRVPEADLVLSDYLVEDEYADKTTVVRPYFENELAPLLFQQKGEVLLDECAPGLYQMHAVAYRTQMARESGMRLDGGVAFTDNEFVYYPLPFIKNVAYCPAIVYRYQLGREGQSMDARTLDKTVDQHYVVACSLLDWYEGLDLDALTPQCAKLVTSGVALTVVMQINRRLYSRRFKKNLEIVQQLEDRLKQNPVLLEASKSGALSILRKTGFRLPVVPHVLLRVKHKRSHNAF